MKKKTNFVDGVKVASSIFTNVGASYVVDGIVSTVVPGGNIVKTISIAVFKFGMTGALGKMASKYTDSIIDEAVDAYKKMNKIIESNANKYIEVKQEA